MNRSIAAIAFIAFLSGTNAFVAPSVKVRKTDPMTPLPLSGVLQILLFFHLSLIPSKFWTSFTKITIACILYRVEWFQRIG
jgi:hypothetical protein